MKSNLSFLSMMFLLFLFGKVGEIGAFASLHFGWVVLPLGIDLLVHIARGVDKQYQIINRLILWTKERKIERIKKKYFNKTK